MYFFLKKEFNKKVTLKKNYIILFFKLILINHVLMRYIYLCFRVWEKKFPTQGTNTALEASK
jgi:hypothetical protein